MKCFIETIIYTIRHWLNGGTAIVEGHTYKNKEVFIDRVVYIDQCEDCGKISITHSDRSFYEVLKKEGKI